MSKHRKMLSDWNAPYIRALMKQIETQSKSTLANWAIDCAECAILPVWKKRRPQDPRPREALDAARSWLSGEVKLPPVKRAILACHAAARESDADPAAQAAARTIAQCASTVHAPTHCIGLAFYGALAIAYDALGADASWEQLESRAASECGLMLDELRAVSAENEPHPAKIDWKC